MRHYGGEVLAEITTHAEPKFYTHVLHVRLICEKKEREANMELDANRLQTQAGIRQCPECKSIRLMQDRDTAEIVCMNCGFVIVAKLTDRGPEWRAFDAEQIKKRARSGPPSTYAIHDKGLSTMIDRYDRDIHGKRLPSSQKAQIYRLRRWQQRIRVKDATERNLAFALSEMAKVSNGMNLPKNVLETASLIYRKAVKERLIRGRSMQAAMSASIYMACRKCGIARALEEIAQASSISKKELGRNYRFLTKELDYSIPLLQPSQYINKYHNQLAMQGKVEDIAQKIFLTARELKLTSGRGPKSVAAAASYIASVLSGERKTQREIAEIAQVTEVTVRNRYKELVERMMFEITL